MFRKRQIRYDRYGFENSLNKIQPLLDSAMEKNLFRKIRFLDHCLHLFPPDRYYSEPGPWTAQMFTQFIQTVFVCISLSQNKLCPFRYTDVDCVTKKQAKVITTLKIVNKFPSYLAPSISDQCSTMGHKNIHFTSSVYAHYLLKLWDRVQATCYKTE